MVAEKSAGEILELVAGVCCKVAKNGGTIFDACTILNASGAPIKPGDLVPHIKMLCDNFDIADELIGHWPQSNGGAVFTGDRFTTIGEFKSSLKTGQHITAEYFGREGYVEIYNYRTKEQIVDNFPRKEWFGTCQRRSIRLLNDWSI